MTTLESELRKTGLKFKHWYRNVYKHSPHWKSLKETALRVAGSKCCKCSCETSNVFCHNKKEVFDVIVSDLRVVCDKCLPSIQSESSKAEFAAFLDICKKPRKRFVSKVYSPKKGIWNGG